MELKETLKYLNEAFALMKSKLLEENPEDMGERWINITTAEATATNALRLSMKKGGDAENGRTKNRKDWIKKRFLYGH